MFVDKNSAAYGAADAQAQNPYAFGAPYQAGLRPADLAQVPQPPLFQRIQALLSELNEHQGFTQNILAEVHGESFGWPAAEPNASGAGKGDDRPSTRSDAIVNTLLEAIALAKRNHERAMALRLALI